MDQIIINLSKINTKSVEILSTILKDLDRIVSLKQSETPININQNMSFQESSMMFNNIENQIKNRDETFYLLGEIRKSLNDFEDEENFDLNCLEKDRDEMVSILEKRIKDLKQSNSSSLSSLNTNSRSDRNERIDRIERNERNERNEYRENTTKPIRSPQYNQQKRQFDKKESKEDASHRYALIQEKVNATKKYITEIKEDMVNELEDICEGKGSKVIFDTEENGWNMESFISSVEGKSKLAFIVFDERKKVFGVFVNETIDTKEWTTDAKLFLMSYVPGNRRSFFYSMLKQNAHDGTSIFKVCEKEENFFFKISNVIYIQNKAKVKESVIHRETEDVFIKANAVSFCGYIYPDNFEATRVVVLQF